MLTKKFSFRTEESKNGDGDIIKDNFLAQKKKNIENGFNLGVVSLTENVKMKYS